MTTQTRRTKAQLFDEKLAEQKRRHTLRDDIRERFSRWLSTTQVTVTVEEANTIVHALTTAQVFDPIPTPIEGYGVGDNGSKLYNAAPDCEHYVVSKSSGVECMRCNGWFCL